VTIEKAELEQLIKWVDDFQHAIKELFENAKNPDTVEGRCARIQGRLEKMRNFLTFIS